MPVISEVVHVVEAARIRPQRSRQLDVSLIDVSELSRKVGVGCAVAYAADHELMQVIVRPSHARSKHAVELRERHVAGNEDAPPHARFDAEQLDSDLPPSFNRYVCTGPSRHGSTSA